MWFIVSGVMLVLVILVILSIHRIPFPEVWIIDRLGTLVEKRAGYFIIIKYFGIDKIYKKVKANIQYDIPLFVKEKKENEKVEIIEEKVEIDLKNGGKVILKDPKIWIIVENLLKAVQTALNFEEQLRELAEHVITGYLNILTYQDVMVMKRPTGLKGSEEIIKKIGKVLEESDGFNNFAKDCEITCKGFTLKDFDFDEKTTAKRQEIIASIMGKEIAQNAALAKQNEMAAIGKTAKNLSKAGFPKDLAFKTASERYQDHLVGEKGDLKKIIWGEGGTISEIAAQWELGKGLLGKRKEEEKGKERKEEKENEAEKGKLFFEKLVKEAKEKKD